jgi:hypothetical protein
MEQVARAYKYNRYFTSATIYFVNGRIKRISVAKDFCDVRGTSETTPTFEHITEVSKSTGIPKWDINYLLTHNRLDNYSDLIPKA